MPSKFFEFEGKMTVEQNEHSYNTKKKQLKCPVFWDRLTNLGKLCIINLPIN